MRHFLFSLVCCLSIVAIQGEELIDEGFTAEQLSVDEEHIYTISSFKEVDYFCTFTESGELAWEIPFGSKIISWKIKKDQIYIFSKHRSGMAYFLSCIEAETGEYKWEKRVYAPIDAAPVEASAPEQS